MPPTNLSLARLADSACDQFEAAWQAGRVPRIEDFLDGTSGSQRSAILRALIAVEVELRRRAGEDVAIGAYRDRFSSDAAAVESAFADRDRRRASSDTNVVRDRAGVAEPAPDTETTEFPSEPDIPACVGPFEVSGLLSSRRFARVYRAIDPQLGRVVAIKVPVPEAVRSPDDRARLLRESRAAAALHHPNISAVHQVGEADGIPFMVTEVLPGQSLADLLNGRKGPLPTKQAAIICRKLALALEAAHKTGLFHRDLTLANVLFDRARKDVVIDLCWPSLDSPTPADAATNVADLGRILQAMSTQVGGQTPSDPHLESICRLAIGADTAARFATMRELADALGEYLAANAETEPVPMATPVPGAMPVPAPAPIVEPAPFEEMVSAFVEDAHAETEAAVEEAVRTSSVPLRRWLVIFGGIAVVAIAGVLVLGTRPATVTVKIPITQRELADHSLSFFLDDRPISAEALAAPVQLTEGEHKLVVKRGDIVVRTMIFVVHKEGGGTVEVKQDSGPVPAIGTEKKAPAKNKRESVPSGIQRQVATYIIRKGGNVRVIDADAALPRKADEYLYLAPISVVAQLPAAFQIVAVGFPPRIASDDDLAVIARIDTVVDMWLVDSQVTDAGLRRLQPQKNLLSLQLDGTEVTDAGLKHLAGLPHLQALYIARNHVTGAGLADLHDSPLERLIIGTEVNDAGLEAIGKIATLRELSLWGPEVTDTGVAHLRGLKELESLGITASKLTNDSLKEIGQLKKLAGLNLNRAAISDDGLKHLAGLKALRRLGLDATSVTDKGLAALEPLKSIYELALINCGVTDAGVHRLLGIKNLKSLTLWNSRVTDSALPDLRQMIWLESLNLEGSRVSRSVLRELRRALPRTNVIPDYRSPSDLAIEQALDLGGTIALRDRDKPAGKLSELPASPVALRGITLEGKKPSVVLFEQLGKANSFEFLVLNKSTIPDEGWMHLKKLFGIQRLELADTGLTNSRIAPIAELSSVTTLNLAGNSIDDMALKDLARLRSLTFLDLTRTKVTDDAVQVFQKSLPNCKIKR